jgi:hypothetical protein
VLRLTLFELADPGARIRQLRGFPGGRRLVDGHAKMHP